MQRSLSGKFRGDANANALIGGGHGLGKPKPEGALNVRPDFTVLGCLGEHAP